MALPPTFFSVCLHTDGFAVSAVSASSFRLLTTALFPAFVIVVTGPNRNHLRQSHDQTWKLTPPRATLSVLGYSSMSAPDDATLMHYRWPHDTVLTDLLRAGTACGLGTLCFLSLAARFRAH